jgi:hypothetical protein
MKKEKIGLKHQTAFIQLDRQLFFPHAVDSDASLFLLGL